MSITVGTWYERRVIAPVPAAACDTLRPLLTGGPRRGYVVGAGRAALYVLLDQPVADAPTVVAVITREAVPLPLAMTLAERRAPWIGKVEPGSRAEIGEWRLQLNDEELVIVATREWAAPRVRPTQHRAERITEPARVLTTLLHHDTLADAVLDTALRPGLDLLADAQRSGSTAQARRAVDALLGAGSGLTPAGDDILAGYVLTLRAFRLAAAVADAAALRIREIAPRRTTALSASLLALATAGIAVSEVVSVVQAAQAMACGTATEGHLEEAAAELLRVGHTSGADTALGVRTALEAAA